MTPRAEGRASGARGDRVIAVDPERMAAFRRALQQQASLDAVAFSGDGRVFHFEAPMDAGLTPGTFVSMRPSDGSGRLLGQITAQDVTVHEGAELKIDMDADMSRFLEGATLSQAGVRVKIRHVAGQGTLLGLETARGAIVQPTHESVFDNAEIKRADGEFVGRYLAAMGGKRVRFDVGRLERCDDAPRAVIRADGFDRHSFLCGQSGSGKTYALGLLIERLLQNTSLRLVIIDPNSDFTRIKQLRSAGEVAGGVDGTYRESAAMHSAAARGVRVLRPDSVAGGADGTLRVAFSDLTREVQAAVLRLDPLNDRDEYSEFWRVANAVGKDRYSLADVHRTAGGFPSEEARHLRLRIENLGVDGWSTWASEDEKSIGDHIRGDWRALVLDTGPIASASEKAVVAVAVLDQLWRRRDDREPVLIVMDEAHNVCPAEPLNAVQEQAMEHCIRIAGEGRKYGLYLFLSSQRPQKLHPNVLSQCDNLILMRMNSSSDLEALSELFSFVSAGLLEEATRFKLGEALLAGKIAPTPFFATLGGRLTREGGADIPAAWAEASQRRPAKRKRGVTS